MIVIVYTRVSTDEQGGAGQEPDCLKLAGELFEGSEVQIVSEVASRGGRRPKWAEVMHHARSGVVRAVVIWAIDRIGEGAAAAQDIRDLTRLEVAVASVQETWLYNAGRLPLLRELLIDVMTWRAADERARLRDRTRMGLAAARAKGSRLGRPPRMPAPARARAAELARQVHMFGGKEQPPPKPREVAAMLVAEGYGAFHPRTVQDAMGKRVLKLTELNPRAARGSS